MMGRWSEFRVVFGCQFALMPRCEFVIVRSGEEVGPFRGILVGVSWLIIISEVFSSALTISAPRVAALSSRVEEYQEASCALKSPIMMISPS